MSIGLLIIRIVVGATVAAHGAQKLFGAFGGHGIDGTAGFLDRLGFSKPRPYAYLLGLSELIGGLSLAAGLLTPIGSAALMGTMTAAALVVHAPNGFFATDDGYELPAIIGAGAAGIAFTGPGAWSVDHAMGWNLAGTAWGLAALGLAVAAVTVVLALRALGQRISPSAQRPALG